ncbi:MAG: hypothetical protein IKJ56_00195, partial [Bacteroidales bacterium]|nr:hypothetical protein [Bacteroidales bacterium]
MKIKSPMIEKVRGKGLLNAVIIKPMNGKEAWDVCLKMAENGVLAKPTTSTSSASLLLWLSVKKNCAMLSKESRSRYFRSAKIFSNQNKRSFRLGRPFLLNHK